MEIGQAVEDGIVQNLTDAAMGTQSLGQAAINVLNQLKRKLIEVAMQQAVSGLGNFLGKALGSIFGGGYRTMGGKSLTTAAGTNIGKIGTMPSNPAFRGAMARGGNVRAGGSYLVGERGAELFTPRTSGMITPNKKIGGDNTTNIVNVTVDATGSAVSGNEAGAEQLGAVIAQAVQAQLVKEKRSGGLLAR